MALLIQKFGGSSLDGPERLSAAALRIAAAYSHGQDVVAVLSARGKTTDQLLEEARAVSPDLAGAGRRTSCSPWASRFPSATWPCSFRPWVTRRWP